MPLSALETRRAKYSAPLPPEQTKALGILIKALKAEWRAVAKRIARDSDIRAILPFIVVILPQRLQSTEKQKAGSPTAVGVTSRHRISRTPKLSQTPEQLSHHRSRSICPAFASCIP
jgi:hypothetical protein